MVLSLFALSFIFPYQTQAPQFVCFLFGGSIFQSFPSTIFGFFHEFFRQEMGCALTMK
jgi:hypothetical protein